MPSRELHAQVAGALEFRARALLGPDAAAIQFVEEWVRAGAPLTVLARAVAADIAYPVSRGFVSHVCQRLSPDARARIKAARRAGRGTRSAPFVLELIPAHSVPSRRNDRPARAIVFRDPPDPQPALVYRG